MKGRAQRRSDREHMKAKAKRLYPWLDVRGVGLHADNLAICDGACLCRPSWRRYFEGPPIREIRWEIRCSLAGDA